METGITWIGLTGLHVTFPFFVEALQNLIKTDLPGCKFRVLVKCQQLAKKLATSSIELPIISRK